MSVLCGTDLSEAAGRAEVAAAHLAARLGAPLHLVHAVDLGRDELYDEPRGALLSWARRHLDRTAIRLRRIGCQVEVHVEAGPPDEVLTELAERLEAAFIVVSAHGARAPRRGSVGSHAERLARGAPVPVLVVRDEAPFMEWAMQGRPLRLLLGADFSAGSQALLRWVSRLCASGPCEIVASHVYWPPGERRRLGVRGGGGVVDPDPEVEAALRRDLDERLAGLGGPVRVRIEPFLGRVSDRLAAIADEERADIVAVGAHQKSALARLWDGSVSRQVLHQAAQSVLCVPAAAAPRPEELPALRTILVATDFSPTGDAAIPLAFAVAPPGSAIHLVHVTSDGAAGAGESARAARRAAEDRLADLIPEQAIDEYVTQIHVIDGRDAAAEITRAAERLGADLLCLGTRGRSGVARVLMGSVARAVLEGTRRPVLLCRAPR